MSSDGTPEPVQGLEGIVTKAAFGTGSKSERNALWLETAQRPLVLRRKGGPSFGDSSLDAYVGQRVRCDGFVVGYTLLADHIEVVGQPDAGRA